MRTAIQDPYGNPLGMTFGVQMLLISNIAVYVIGTLFHVPFDRFFALHANWLASFSAWELITYQFLHRGFGHLFANMLGLYFLGPETERALGTNRFFALYFLSGILGGLGWSLMSHPFAICVGASGAIFGILGAYAALFPNHRLAFIFLPFTSIKAWVLILILGSYELLQTLVGPTGHIANAAHLGGGIAGYIYAFVIGRPDILRKIKRKII